MQQNVENNRLIALFMGAKIGNPVGKTEVLVNVPDFYSKRTTSTHATKDLQYHKCWGWLMPVVEKIESLNYTSDMIYMPGMGTRLQFHSAGALVCGHKFFNTKIEAVYKSVISFINWYNQQSQCAS